MSFQIQNGSYPKTYQSLNSLQKRSCINQRQWTRLVSSNLHQQPLQQLYRQNVIKYSSLSASEDPSQDSQKQNQGDPPAQNESFLSKIKRSFTEFKPQMVKDAFKQYGFGAMYAYGGISNVVYAGGMSLTWAVYVRQFQKTPLFPGEWKSFLAFFAGYWTINNFLRPMRLMLAIYLAPASSNFLNKVQSKLKINKVFAIIIMLIIMTIATFSLSFLIIFVGAGPHAFDRIPWQ